VAALRLLLLSRSGSAVGGRPGTPAAAPSRPTQQRAGAPSGVPGLFLCCEKQESPPALLVGVRGGRRRLLRRGGSSQREPAAARAGRPGLPAVGERDHPGAGESIVAVTRRLTDMPPGRIGFRAVGEIERGAAGRRVSLRAVVCARTRRPPARTPRALRRHLAQHALRGGFVVFATRGRPVDAGRPGEVRSGEASGRGAAPLPAHGVPGGEPDPGEP
jgi:hypothetical protein